MTMGRTAVRCPTVVGLYFVCIGLLYPILAEEALKITAISAKREAGFDASVTCTTSSNEANITWFFNNETLKFDNPTSRITEKISEGIPTKDKDGNKIKPKISTIIIANATPADAGEYTCVASLGEAKETNVTNLDLSFHAKHINVTLYTNANANTNTNTIHANVSENVHVECVFEAYNVSEVRWYMKGKEATHHSEIPWRINPKLILSNHSIQIHSAEDNGTHVCEIEDLVSHRKEAGTFEILVFDKPTITAHVLPISRTEVYLNWTVYTYNSEVITLSLWKMNLNQSLEFMPMKPLYDINQKNNSFIITGLKNSTNYTFRVEVKTNYGSNKSNLMTVKTLAEDPIFVPNISINGFSATSVTIGWAPPPKEYEQYIHHYLLEARKKNETEAKKTIYFRDGRNLPYMFGSLDPHSTYVFQVRACSEYGVERCWLWSDEMEAATLDGSPSKPTNVTAHCSRNYMNLTWDEPERPNAEIKGYTMELTGKASFKDRLGVPKNITWGPLSKFTTNDTRSVRFDDLQPNTEYTVKINAMTRTRRRGEEETSSCPTPPAPPDQPPRPRWWKIKEEDKYSFKVQLPRISERNGRICCYRVYMVRLPLNTDWKTQPATPKALPVFEHKDLHGDKPAKTHGAYITDIFSNEGFPPKSELVMGDSVSYFNRSDPMLTSKACRRCLQRPERAHHVPAPTTTTTTTTTMSSADEFGEDEDDFTTEISPDVEEERKIRSVRGRYSRSLHSNGDYSGEAMMANASGDDEKLPKVFDGPLDPTSNYTLFVELIPGLADESPIFSHCLNSLMPAPTPVAPQPTTALEIALQATCAIAALVLLLMLLFCIRQSRRSRKLPPHAHIELNPLQLAYRYFTGRGGRAQLVPSAPPNMAPIAKEDLAAAYAERQVDSDYLFQKEFEMLPECFTDRTTHASEARENQPKNRYPDIKAYDQTRVKLSQIDGITGSDYINANYVNGYQEGKQFICAQGPTDTTVNDFWRMIWEHGLELIVMLTNLEEYSKVKCSKYWPDDVRGARNFGCIMVQQVSERRYSDYIVRELRITKQPAMTDGQPIVENNGIKRNGDCKEAADGSVPTSPREVKEVKEADSRIVKQYHFLMWKDFAAPEHAYSILKFIKRVNEAWEAMVGRACVVHCSAGVGRTGTLVALDCLLAQLRAHGHAAVFNTVAELRRQRNFLVQSLKQYVFVYRALVEFAHYGDTEIPACKLKASIDGLRNTPPGAAHCLMEIEFEKIQNSPVPEPLKSCAAGAAEELRSKNRSQEILPYDRNRVILAPIPTRDYSTYINASFIEAYDNTEGFIITQDPLPSTIMDFWRMVSEHNVSTIVMLSELGESKCPRYWDDNTAQYDHISVQYEESESCPYYTRRQFRVNNNKVIGGSALVVRHLQYQGWPTAPGAVPEVTRGLAELADAAAAAPAPPAPPPTMLVHCQLGTERSALFVALCVLICQLRTERRVDVCSVARKVREQRAKTVDTFLHYEFLHRAILNYAELHNLLEDS